MKKITFLMIMIFITTIDKAIAQSPTALPTAASSCIGCHGPQGISPSSLWPNLAGQKKDYIKKQLEAFKTGSRLDPMMNPVAAQLTENDIENIAQYFSQLK